MTSVKKPSDLKRAGGREWRALAVLTLAVTLLAVDGTVMALAVPSLTVALDPTPLQILWIGDIYSFALAGLLITMGNVADRIGHDCENDRDGARLLQQGAGSVGVLRNNQVRPQRDEFLRASLMRIRVVGWHIANVNRDVRPAELLKLAPGASATGSLANTAAGPSRRP